MRHLQPVVWSKGVFLSPQHLQAQDRFFEDTLRFLSGALSFSNWGFTALQIDSAGLSEGRLSVSQASGIFPDGLMLDLPTSDAPPASRALDECFSGGRDTCAFFLAVPQDRPGGTNIALQRGGVSTRFYSELQMLRDENSSGVEKPVSLARKNLQILAEGENLEGSVLLPLAQIERTEAGGYRLDPKYVPPLLNIKGNELLTGILRGEIETLIARSSQLAGSRRQRNQSLADFSASDIANFWLLYTINTHLPVSRHMLDARQAHPEALFLHMLSLAGALTTFSSKIEPRDLPRYEHERLGSCFLALDATIAELLETVVPSNFVALPLKPLRDSIYAAAIDKDRYFENSRPYLAVSSDLNEADLIARFPALAKACSATHIEQLIRQALPGVKLTHVPVPPRAIPVKLRYQYFSLERSGPVWDAIVRARNFAVYAPAEIPNPEMELIFLFANPD
ncbi:MAG: type VI secretion system baseplate subunit TssK [Acidobacteriota bacterium]|nr:type VI secretion system baseplate subunit TssK [Acidobacteriota bacterium]